MGILQQAVSKLCLFAPLFGGRCSFCPISLLKWVPITQRREILGGRGWLLGTRGRRLMKVGCEGKHLPLAAQYKKTIENYEYTDGQKVRIPFWAQHRRPKSSRGLPKMDPKAFCAVFTAFHRDRMPSHIHLPLPISVAICCTAILAAKESAERTSDLGALAAELQLESLVLQPGNGGEPNRGDFDCLLPQPRAARGASGASVPLLGPMHLLPLGRCGKLCWS